jgi:hypothetical protein
VQLTLRSSLDRISSARAFPAVMSTLNLPLFQLDPKMLAQRLLLDAKLIGDFGLCDAKSRSALDERALFGGRRKFSSSHLEFQLRYCQTLALIFSRRHRS